MVMLNIKFISYPFDKLKSQCALVTTFSDLRPLKGVSALVDWRLNGRLSKILIKNRFCGDYQEVMLLPSEGRIKSDYILVLGLGPRGSFNESHVGLFLQFMLEKITQMKLTDFVISISDMIPDRFEWRNSIRLLASKLHDYQNVSQVNLCESDEYVKDAKRRHMDFGMNVNVSFEMNSV